VVAASVIGASVISASVAGASVTLSDVRRSVITVSVTGVVLLSVGTVVSVPFPPQEMRHSSNTITVRRRGSRVLIGRFS
jgi:hypothetical protein